MAEFQEVMRQWKRMCDAYTTDDAASCCKGCPMSGRGCGSIYESGNADPDVIERETMSWAAEHPEPVYPTWKEWLEEQCVVVHFDSVSEKGTKVKWELTNKSNCRIPADIAEKLGIEPKEK